MCRRARSRSPGPSGGRHAIACGEPRGPWHGASQYRACECDVRRATEARSARARPCGRYITNFGGHSPSYVYRLLAERAPAQQQRIAGKERKRRHSADRARHGVGYSARSTHGRSLLRIAVCTVCCAERATPNCFPSFCLCVCAVLPASTTIPRTTTYDPQCDPLIHCHSNLGRNYV